MLGRLNTRRCPSRLVTLRALVSCVIDMEDQPTIQITKRTVFPGSEPVESTVEMPRRLGSVVLQRQIGKGGMGVVWLGRHELLNREVAVKFLLNLKPAEDDPGFDVMLEGARAAAAILHEGLNRVLHADVIDGVPFLVMEFVEGPTVAELIAAHGALSPAVTRAIMERLCNATAELHDNGVVHRDIKPSNILLSPEAKPVLTDFGLACFRSGEELQFTVASVAGTPSYMATEMWDRHVSARSDVYALGIVLFELLTGRMPFVGDVDELEYAHRHSPMPAELLSSMHPDIASLIERCTNKNPIYRYKSARHLSRAIEEAFDELGADVASRSKGEQELPRLVSAIRNSATRGESAGKSEQLSYYDRIGTLAGSRKKSASTIEASGDEIQIERVQEDLHCTSCGGNLKGEPITGRCVNCLWLIKNSIADKVPEKRPDPDVADDRNSDAAPLVHPKPSFREGLKDFLRDFFAR